MDTGETFPGQHKCKMMHNDPEILAVVNELVYTTLL